MDLVIKINALKAVKTKTAEREETFSLLYRNYARGVFNSVWRITNNYAETEDIVQEAFCVAFEQIDRLRDPDNFGGWIKRIALNKAISHLRSRKIVLTNNEDMLDTPDENPDTEKEIMEQSRVEDVKAAIQALPDGFRTIVSMYLLDNIPQEEIAAMLGISHSTVRSQYHRAKKKILASLKDKSYHEK
ncbi:MAG TPA: sigma-70 family RNA polymerase sigma factor [Ginsengibacter sp.]|nr:sigma-70 family RNA polymerase sigma factor [Ginsengibacter sp.]HRP17242.1 sigma-70 family RNA polymerase sigma factor [Ginsengibacter sp.]HRP44381.1 sigma-70 family RNA polymerase sigma factor [Ginsengibacter sp.]